MRHVVFGGGGHFFSRHVIYGRSLIGLKTSPSDVMMDKNTINILAYTKGFRSLEEEQSQLKVE